MDNFSTLMVALAGGLALTALLGYCRPRAAPLWAALAAGLGALALGLFWLASGAALIDLPWYAPTGSRLVLRLDGLSGPFATFAAALAALVLCYTRGYLPHWLAERQQKVPSQAWFCALLLGFMLAMVVLALARDLLLLFAALETTALLSFLLISYERNSRAAQHAAWTALVVTGGSALLFLLGTLLISARQGTTVLAELDSISAPAAWLLSLGLLAKSAQMPLHFWLPRAMAAPTPVSAYLHSAALVAAGVYVLLRLQPLLADMQSLSNLLLGIGLTTALLGGLLALCADHLKRLLAYSTMAQYGHVLVLIALGGELGLVGAPLFIMAHGLCKATLFMIAGAITHATGQDRLSRATGSWRTLPAPAVAAAIAGAGLAGLPATIGFFKEEYFLEALAHHGPLWGGLGAAAAALTLAYMGRFWWGLFGPRRAGRHEALPANAALIWPSLLLGLLVLLGGLLPGLAAPLFTDAGAAVAGATLEGTFHYSLNPRPALWLTLAAWGGGALLLVLHGRYERALSGSLSWLGARFGPAALADGLSRLSDWLSESLHELEVLDLRDRVAAVLLPAAALVLLGWAALGRFLAPVGNLGWNDLPLATALLLTAVSAVLVTLARRHMNMVLMLSFVGFGLALVFSIAEAPEVALVVVIIETLFTLLFVTMLAWIPAHRRRAIRERQEQRNQGAWVACVAGFTAFMVAWTALGEQRELATFNAFTRFVEEAHAADVVTAIIADFRGFDTLGEITVLVIALMGAVAITRKDRP